MVVQIRVRGSVCVQVLYSEGERHCEGECGCRGASEGVHIRCERGMLVSKY